MLLVLQNYQTSATLVAIMHDLIDHIIATKVDEVIVVDFPGFNLRLIKKLKQKIQILQLPIFHLRNCGVGERGAYKSLSVLRQSYCSLSLEVAWYQKRGLTVECWVTLSMKRCSISQRAQRKYDCIDAWFTNVWSDAFAATLLTSCCQIAWSTSIVAVYYSSCAVIPLSALEAIVHSMVWMLYGNVLRGTDEQESSNSLHVVVRRWASQGRWRLSLHVGIQQSWPLKHRGLRILSHVHSLKSIHVFAELLLGKELFKEIIQWRCTPVLLAQYLNEAYTNAVNKTEAYQVFCKMSKSAAKLTIR